MPAAAKISNVVSIRVVNFSKTIFNFLARFSMITLAKSNVNCSWHIFTVSILEVLNNFMKNLFITKSGDFKSVLVNGQTSKQYSRIGKHLLLTSCNNFFGRYAAYFTKNCVGCTVETTFSIMQ